MRHCQVCGKDLDERHKQFCSSACRRKYYQQERSNPYFKEAEKRTRPKADFYEVVTGAEREGLSYGYYVARHGV